MNEARLWVLGMLLAPLLPAMLAQLWVTLASVRYQEREGPGSAGLDGPGGETLMSEGL